VIRSYLEPLDYAVVLIYILAVISIGVHLRRRASTSLDEYLIGARALPWWMLGISGVMDFWDLAGTMIIVSFLYMLGPRGLFIEFRGGAVLVLAVTMLWTGKWHRRSGCLTAGEWMIYRFGDGTAGRLAQFSRASAGIVVTVGMFGYLAKGAGLFLSSFVPCTPAQCAFVLLVISALYTMVAGFRGVVATHILQMVIILLAAAIIIVLGVERGQRIDRDVDPSGDQLLLQLRRGLINDLQLDAGVAGAHVGDEIEQIGWRDGAHQAEAQGSFLQAQELLRLAFGVLGTAIHLVQVRLERAAELGEVSVRALAMKQCAAKLFFQLLDGAGEGGLRHIAALGGTREIQFTA